MGRAAIFFDKDGTLIEDRPYNVDPHLIAPTEGASEALSLLARFEYDLFIVSNQSGVAHGYFSEEAMAPMVDYLRNWFNSCGAKLGGFYYCPHHPNGKVKRFAIDCNCRKPQPGLILKAAQERSIDLSRSWVVGDILHDVEAGHKSGCRSILIDNGNETEWVWAPGRLPYYFARDLFEAARFILKEDGYVYSERVLEEA